MLQAACFKKREQIKVAVSPFYFASFSWGEMEENCFFFFFHLVLTGLGKKAKHYNCFINAEPLRLTRFNSVICCEQKSWKKLFFPLFLDEIERKVVSKTVNLTSGL